ncbi:hypothetical protein [Wielerella bovis]|uniref:hypothetical protein n=1 Tax=Wielerella bovis TaxID=2917790 RepID=UPI002019BEB3|nr:hypothetical protein [Wielerella bovis]ULJ65333.1 hypothetical protein MIS33_03410 [Wielerella bovis]ULJ67680.1 hypothetical protein MIS31_03785 [Wielerella bovis]
MYQTRTLSFSHQKSLQLHAVKGKLLAAKRDLETSIHASGGGGKIEGRTNGAMFGGSGSLYGSVKGKIDPISIHSQTFVHDELFVLDETTGNEYAFQFTDWQITCRPDHEMTLVWWQNAEGGATVYLYNHTLGEEYLARKGFPNFIGGGSATLITFAKAVLLVMVLAIMWFAWDWVGLMPENGFGKLIAYVAKIFLILFALGFVVGYLKETNLPPYLAPQAESDKAEFEQAIRDLAREVNEK